MAEKSPEATSRKLEDQLTCAVCLGQYDDPRTLPCLHSFCTKCLGELPLEQKGDNKYCFFCPTCRTPVDLPGHGVTAFPKSFHLNSLIELQQDLAKVQDLEVSGNSICDNCKTEEATAGYCPDCDKVLCSSCNDVHKKWGPMSTHKLVSVESKVAAKVKPAPVVQQSCPSHHKSLDLYCVTCEELICSHCTIQGHKGHTHDVVSEEGEKELNEKVAALSEKIEKISRIREELKANQKIIEEKGDHAKEAIRLLIEGAVSAFQVILQLNTQQITTSTQNKIKFEEQQVQTVNTFLDVLICSKEQAQRCLAEDAPSQLLMIKKQLAKIDSLLASDECESIKPLEKPLTLNDIPETEEELKKFMAEAVTEISGDISGTIVSIDSHSKEFYQQCYFVPKSIPATVHQSEESQATFQIMFQGQPVMVDTDDIVCSFIDDGDAILCEVSHNNELCYGITFTPEKVGCYTFTIELAWRNKQTLLIVQIGSEDDREEQNSNYNKF